MPRFRRLLVFAAAALAGPAAFAQTAITALTTSVVAGTTSSHDTPAVNFDNTRISISTFTAGGNTYAATGLADQAFVRRNTTGPAPNQSSVWYRDSTANPGAQLGSYSTTYSSLMLQNNIASGSDNTFANGTPTYTAQDGNIERLDFVFNGGMVASASQVFAVFERGAAGAHDLFKIAVITGWDSINNVPTAYSTLVGPSASSAWGATNPTSADLPSSFGYHLFRYNTGDNLTTSTAHNETGSQGIGGIMFTMAQLGIAPGTTIYGYSLFGNDVTDGGNTANLLDHTNTLYFPTNTPNTTGTGGIDLATINGISFSAVPEPSTYALGGIAAMLVAVVVHHRRRRRAASSAVSA